MFPLRILEVILDNDVSLVHAIFAQFLLQVIQFNGYIIHCRIDLSHLVIFLLLYECCGHPHYHYRERLSILPSAIFCSRGLTTPKCHGIRDRRL